LLSSKVRPEDCYLILSMFFLIRDVNYLWYAGVFTFWYWSIVRLIDYYLKKLVKMI